MKGSKGDEYYTPKSVWENISHLIPKEAVICEPFNNKKNIISLNSWKNLKDLGFKMYPQKIFDEETNENSFFDYDGDGWDILVSNVPFSIKQDIIAKLVEMDKPFIIIVPTITITNKYITKLGNDIQLILPKSRLQYDGCEYNKTNCSFSSLYLCWKMKLPRDIIML